MENKENIQYDLQKNFCRTCSYEKVPILIPECLECIHNEYKLKSINNNWRKEFKFEKNKWYTNSDEYFCFQNKTNDGYIMGYGFTISKYWRHAAMFDFGILRDWELADMKEVEELLIAKAKKDYSKNTFLNSLNNTKCISNEYFCKFDENIQVYVKNYNGNHLIYNNGKWASVIKVKESMESTLKLGKHKVTFIKFYGSDSFDALFINTNIITIEEWREWYNKKLIFKSHTEFIDYVTYIDNMFWEQVQLINETIENL